MTLSALNAPDADVDIEGLSEQSSVKRLEFDSGRVLNNMYIQMSPLNLITDRVIILLI